jgi:hypothetical protein
VTRQRREGDLSMTTQPGWNRRRFLRAAGVAIALPFFPSLFPRSAWAADGDPADVPPPVRLMFCSVPLGFVPSVGDQDGLDGQGTARDQKLIGESDGWFPKEDGPDYQLPNVHAALAPYREHVSFFRGLCNARYRSEIHCAVDALLTCADTLIDPSRMTNTISCDQVAAAQWAKVVRHPSLVLGNPVRSFGSNTLSWTKQGVPLSPMTSPGLVFDRLFGKDDVPAEERLQRLKEKRSFLDATVGQIQDLDRRLNPADRRKLEEVTTAVREVEEEIQRDEHWMDLPKPTAPCARPAAGIDSDPLTIRHCQAMLDLAHAAFLTDSTRVVTYSMPDTLHEVSLHDKHNLNHPNGDEQIAKESGLLDAALSAQMAHLAKLLCDSKEHDGQPLMRHAAVFYGSALWGATHFNRHLPAMLIGEGGGRLKQGVARSYPEKTPLANLWLGMLKAAGVAVDSFGDSTGVLDGLMA